MITYRLVQLTDFEILEVSADGRRTGASNLSVRLDRKRTSLNTRLRELAGQEFLTDVGPSGTAGLYDSDREACTAAVDEFAAKITIESLAISDRAPTE
ncbi:ArsR family transcriptional regulator [Halobellus inordinatus]|uniref:ArsR family transcriptional regulator n=1 Tax=Halobellus inordinatus TaxID=1126236 RepID=UPI0021150029|nr:ArsR family transcriptional regulator [Halobellus ramosii]